MDHQRPLQLLLVTAQISVKLAPPEGNETFLRVKLRKGPTEVKLHVLPVVQLLPPLSNSNQFISAPSLLQPGCQFVDGLDVGIIHCHILQIEHNLSTFLYQLYLAMIHCI